MQGEADAHHYPWSQLNIEQVCPCENSVLAESSQGKVEKLYEVDPVGSPIGSHFFIFVFLIWAVRSRARAPNLRLLYRLHNFLFGFCAK